jgi:Uma2 family endonuclease
MSTPIRSQGEAQYEDILALPVHVVGEIVDGELHVSPRPASPHAVASSTLGMDLGGAYQRGRGGPGGWWIVDEPELHLGRDVLVTDLAGWRKSRMPEMPSVPYFTLSPDWVCEVLSPGTASFDRVRKMRAYAREAVGHAWLVDPLERTLEVYRLYPGGGTWILVSAHSAEEVVRAEPFDGIDLRLADLWIPLAAGDPPPATGG